MSYFRDWLKNWHIGMPQGKVIKVIKKAIFDSNESALLPNKTDHKKVLIRSKVMFVLEKTFFVIAQPYLVA